MEAQPIALVIIVAAQIFSSGTAGAPIGADGITLLELALLWWAMLMEYLTRRFGLQQRAFWLHIIGWLVALALLIGPYVPSLLNLHDILPALLLLALCTWLWRRGIANVQFNFEYSRIATSFKIGFGVILGALLIATLVAQLPTLRAALPTALPIFFVSGLLALSLARLGVLRATRAGTGEAHADPTRAWLLALTILSVALIVLVLIVDSIFSFSTLEAIIADLSPLWNAIGTVVNWILYGLVFLLSPIFYLVSFLVSLLHGSPKPPQINASSPISNHTKPGAQTQAIISEFIVVGRWIFLAVFLIIIAAIVIRTLRRWVIHSREEGVEEIREGLDARSMLAQRLRDWLNRRRRQVEPGMGLEPLDPLSARAHYRTLLQEVALADETLARKPAETPEEYRLRLIAALQSLPETAQQAPGAAAPPATTMLDTLTDVYIDERYGGKSPDQRRYVNVREWIPQLVTRLTGKVPRRARS